MFPFFLSPTGHRPIGFCPSARTGWGRDKLNRCPGAGQRARKRLPHGDCYSACGKRKGRALGCFPPSRKRSPAKLASIFQWPTNLAYTNDLSSRPFRQLRAHKETFT